MKKILIYTLAILSLAVVNQSCSYVDLETEDPNNFTDAPSELMINQPLLSLCLVQEGDLARITGIFSNQFTGADRQYLSLNQYITTTGDYDNIWATLYVDGVAQCKIIEQKAATLNLKKLQGVAKIVRAYLIGTAADLWGDVPYTEAANDLKYPMPKYDNQVSVYDSLQVLLDKAIDLYKVGADSDNGKVYGNLTLDKSVLKQFDWLNVAYSLKARYFLHAKNYQKALDNALKGIGKPEQSWIFNHDDNGNYSDGKFNLFYSFLEWNRGGYLNADDAYLPRILDSGESIYRGNAKTNEAARFKYYFLSGGDAVYASLYDPNMSDGIFAVNSGYTLLSYAETRLIEAECYLRIAVPNKQAALNALNQVRQALNTYYGGNFYQDYVDSDFLTNSDLLKEILLEKYISLFGQIEVYNDLRRSNNLIGVPLKKGAVLNKIPERLLYPQTEVGANKNMPAIQSIDKPTRVNGGNS